MGRRWGKIEKDFCTKNKTYDISKIPDIYDCIKYDLQHNQHTLQFDMAEELYIYAKYLADIVIPQVPKWRFEVFFFTSRQLSLFEWFILLNSDNWSRRYKQMAMLKISVKHSNNVLG